MRNYNRVILSLVVFLFLRVTGFAQDIRLLKPASFFKNDTVKGFSYNFDASANYNNVYGQSDVDAVFGVGYKQTLVPKKLNLKVSLISANRGFKQLNTFNNEPFKGQSIGFYDTKPISILPEIDLSYNHKGVFASVGVAPQQFLNLSNNLFFSPSGGPMPYITLGYKHKLFTYQYMANYSPQASYSNPPANRFPSDKLIATHLIEIPIFKWLKAGFYESVVFLMEDTNGIRGFDLAYLNPAVVFRPVEYNNGSADNVLLGAWLQADVAEKFSIKAQVLLDEFLLKEVKAQNGWWANKFGALLSLQYKTSSAKASLNSELNILAVRPYTYSHTSPYQSYTNGSLNIGPVLGSNFMQFTWNTLLTKNKNSFLFNINTYVKGYSSLGRNVGQNPLLDNSSRQKEYGNYLAQGGQQTQSFSGLVRYSRQKVIANKINVYAEVQYVKTRIEYGSAYAFRLGLNTNLTQLFYNY